MCALRVVFLVAWLLSGCSSSVTDGPPSTQAAAPTPTGQATHGPVDPSEPPAAQNQPSEETSPEPAQPPRRVDAIDAGESHTCALRDDATVACWGDGGHARLGSIHPTSAVPVEVEGLRARGIGLHRYGGCAVTLEGRVECWGISNLGRGAIQERPTPIPGFEGVREVFAGNGLCARFEDESVRCVGPWRHDPPADVTRVRELEGTGQIVLGPTACRRSEGGGVRCFVRSRDGSNSWARVPGVRGDHIDGGGARVCVPTPARIRCWGSTDWARRAGQFAPDVFSEEIVGARLVATSPYWICGVTDEALDCRAQDPSVTDLRLPWSRPRIVAVTAAREPCVLDEAGRVSCVRDGALAPVELD